LSSLTQIQEVPPKSLILLVGPPGSGKSTFCEQTILQNLAIDKPIIYVTTEYDPSRAEEALRAKGLGKIEKGLLSFVDAYNETVGVSVSERPDAVYADCNDLSSIDIAISKLQDRIGKKGILLVFDSLTSPYLFTGPEMIRFMRMTLSRFAARGNAVLASIDDGCGKSEDLVAMMSLSDGVIRINTEEDRQLFNVVKHPRERPTRIVASIEPKGRLRKGRLIDFFDLSLFGPVFRNMLRGGIEKFLAEDRKEVGVFMNRFWPNLVHWSGMLWDPKKFPMMKYELNKWDSATIRELVEFFPLRMRLALKFMPKNFSKVKDMKKLFSSFVGHYTQELSGIPQYLDDISKTDEHYIRIHDSFDCYGFENVNSAMALYLPSSTAGMCMGLESLKGLERDWNAVETKCIGLGDPYCEFKFVPDEIDELRDSLEKNSAIVELIHDQLIQHLMQFMLHKKPLMERPKLGSDVHIHAVGHAMGFPYLAGERYQMAMRMGGAIAGKEIGEHLIATGIGEDDAVQRMTHLLEHCKVGKVMMGETMRIRGNIESITLKFLKEEMRPKEPSCLFTTGFLNGFFYAVKNQHVKETKCIAMGDPYCEWEFR
jgi:KaiC/GvpD/RAD55 family RecA-like ATPase/predicted hydrocarbon binding protein